MTQALSTPDAAERHRTPGMEASLISRAALDPQLRQDRAEWAPIIQRSIEAEPST